MIIDPLSKKINGKDLFLEYKVDFSQKTEILCYSIDVKYDKFISELLDGPLIALLIPAMALGEDIYINGSISERIFYNLSKTGQRLLKQIIPSLKLINIYPKEIESNSQRASGVATGFSGGVDSFCLLDDHFFSKVPEGYKITHLLFNNVGSHGRKNERLFEDRYRKSKTVADQIGLPLLKVNSNIDKFYDGYGFQLTHSLRNVSIPLILQNGIGRFLYASTFDFRHIHVEPTYDIAYVDPILLPLLSTEVLDIISSGSEYTRVEKTVKVAKINSTYDSLDVCVDRKSAGNCSKCWKCMRTMLTLDIAGFLDQYSKVFDKSIYMKERTSYIAKILFSNDPLLEEIVQFAKEKEYVFPFKSYILGIYYKFLNQIRNFVKLIRKSRFLTKNFYLRLFRNNPNKNF